MHERMHAYTYIYICVHVCNLQNSGVLEELAAPLIWTREGFPCVCKKEWVRVLEGEEKSEIKDKGKEKKRKRESTRAHTRARKREIEKARERSSARL